MSKPTILILLIVYVSSILIVGIFGLQIMSFNNINYIDSITVDVKNVSFSKNKHTLSFISNSVINEAIPYMRYTLIFEYASDQTLAISPKIVAKNPNIDPTDNRLTVTLTYSQEAHKGCITYENSLFKINRPGGVTVTYRSQDNSGKIMVVYLFATPPNTTSMQN